MRCTALLCRVSRIAAMNYEASWLIGKHIPVLCGEKIGHTGSLSLPQAQVGSFNKFNKEIQGEN